MLARFEQSHFSSFPNVDLSSSPNVDRVTALKYWGLFLYRYYFIGREQHGAYGSPWCIKKMKPIEESIKNQSIPSGDSPTLPIPELTIDEISPQQRSVSETEYPSCFSRSSKALGSGENLDT
jgi:hypothetical protein